MLPRRMGPAALVIVWLAAMTWLVSTKIIPAYRVPQPRGYPDLLSEAGDTDTAARWLIKWDGQPIGRADYRLQHEPDGGATIHSRVDFQRLPVADLMESFLGVMVQLLPHDFRQEMDVSLDGTVTTTIHFDAYNHLMDLDASAGLANSPPLIFIRGTNAHGILRIHSRVSDDDRNGRGISYVTEVPMEADGFQIDVLAPVPRLKRLHVGQTWHQRTLRPLSATAQWETLRAEVVSWEPIDWDGQEQGAFRVQFETESAGSLSVTQRPVGQMWVLRDGRVVRQQLKLASVTFEFERIP